MNDENVNPNLYMRLGKRSKVHIALTHPDAQIFELGKLAEGVNAPIELVVVNNPE